MRFEPATFACPVLAAGIPCADGNGNGLPDTWESYWASKFGLGNMLDPNALSRPR